MKKSPSGDRYHRQALFFRNGDEAQERLRSCRVLIVGCGALGTQCAEQLARAGTGCLRLVDRDFVEWSNLHRQIGFDEHDARERRAKAEALAAHLRRVNSEIELLPHAVDFNYRNCLELATGCDLLIDGTDNLATRFLLNDVSLHCRVPWIYCGAIGGEGHVQFFGSEGRPCLRCQLPDLPAPGSLPTCDTHGVIGPAAGVAAAWQAGLALRFLTTGDEDRLAGKKAILSPWKVDARVVRVAGDPRCRVCVDRELACLRGKDAERIAHLCGRKAVQVLPASRGRTNGGDTTGGDTTGGDASFDLDAAARRLGRLGPVQQFPRFLRFEGEDFLLTLFTDGRAVFDGLTDRDLARSLYARLVGQ